MPEVLAPELQSTCSVINGSFSRQSDNFSLAIHIFRLLMNNEDPFGGIVTTGESMSTIVANRAICNGECPYVRKVPSRRIPPHAPSLGILPSEIINLFQRTFDYSATTAIQNIPRRSTAKEWCLALAPYGAPNPNPRLKTCSVNLKHVYPDHNKECPWCKTEVHETAVSQIQSTASTLLSFNTEISAKKTVSTGQSVGKTVTSRKYSRNSAYLGKSSRSSSSSRKSSRSSSSSRKSTKKTGKAGKIAAITISLFIIIAIVCSIFYHYNIFGFNNTLTSGIEWLTEQLFPEDFSQNNGNISFEYIIPDIDLSDTVLNEYKGTLGNQLSYSNNRRYHYATI